MLMLCPLRACRGWLKLTLNGKYLLELRCGDGGTGKVLPVLWGGFGID